MNEKSDDDRALRALLMEYRVAEADTALIDCAVLRIAQSQKQYAPPATLYRRDMVALAASACVGFFIGLWSMTQHVSSFMQPASLTSWVLGPMSIHEVLL